MGFVKRKLLTNSGRVLHVHIDPGLQKFHQRWTMLSPSHDQNRSFKECIFNKKTLRIDLLPTTLNTVRVAPLHLPSSKKLSWIFSCTNLGTPPGSGAFTIIQKVWTVHQIAQVAHRGAVSGNEGFSGPIYIIQSMAGDLILPCNTSSLGKYRKKLSKNPR